MQEDATAVEVSAVNVNAATRIGPGQAGPARASASSAVTGAHVPVLRPRVRFLEGIKQRSNWVQLVQFGVVGGVGFVINLAVYALCVHVLSIDFRGASVVAWLVAVLNNFVLNRRWTFDARDIGRAHHQAWRFLVVSLLAEGVSLGLLQLFVDGGIAKVPAQALAVALSMPLNFLGNKLWSFRAQS